MYLYIYIYILIIIIIITRNSQKATRKKTEFTEGQQNTKKRGILRRPRKKISEGRGNNKNNKAKEEKKLAEEANALQIKAAIDEYTDEIDPNGLGSIQNQVDLQQFSKPPAI